MGLKPLSTQTIAATNAESSEYSSAFSRMSEKYRLGYLLSSAAKNADVASTIMTENAAKSREKLIF